MKFLVSPNAFKGTIEAGQAAEIIGEALQDCIPNASIHLAPIADGGDGTCDLLGSALGLEKQTVTTVDAIGRSCKGYYFLEGKHAYMDVSTVSGIKHLKSYQRNPWLASSYGTGELIKDAISHGVEEVILGLGGSASIDLGLGILGGLGYQFLDEKGRAIAYFSDSFFTKIKHIQAPIKKQELRFRLLCDVNNTFFGNAGAIPVFGPQKGLPTTEFEAFENTLRELLNLLAKKTKKTVSDQASFGAAGGIAYGLSYFYNVKIEAGASYFFDTVNLEEQGKHADWIITGEGMYDAQSAAGKGSYELLQLAKKHQKPILLITAGSGGEGSGFEHIVRLPALNMDKPDFQEIACKNLSEAVSNFCQKNFIT